MKLELFKETKKQTKIPKKLFSGRSLSVCLSLI